MISAPRLPLAAASLAVLASTANASDRWQEAGGGAVAILPAPLEAATVTGGSLHCAEQRWSLRLRLDGEIDKAADGRSGIDIDGAVFAAAPEIARGFASVPIPHEALDLLKQGSRLGISFAGDPGKPDAVFSLRGSRAVLDAIAPRCSQVDMSAYKLVELRADDPAVAEAKPLLAEWARDYRDWSGSQSAYAAAVLDLAPGRKLMFASICGAAGYFGASGCSLNGYASEGAAAWRLVYETEGVRLHTDPSKGTDIWPDLVTLSSVNGAEPTRWVWNGSRYELRELVAEQPTVAEQGDAPAR